MNSETMIFADIAARIYNLHNYDIVLKYRVNISKVAVASDETGSNMLEQSSHAD